VKILKNVSLANKTSFSIGGNATIIEVENINELKNIKVPYIIMGGGTNILFPSENIKIPIVQIKNTEINIKDNKILAGAGVNMHNLVQKCAENNLDASSLAYPGTLGGAIYGNAGTDNSISTYLINATLFNIKTKKKFNVDNQYFEFKYRHSKLQNDKNIIVWSAEFLFPKEDKKNIIEKLKNRVIKRSKTQEVSFSAGSFFKNPKDDYAGRLLEDAECKGMREGDAEISKIHANFIINKGNASQKDVIILAKRAQKRVQNKFGILLETEVQIFNKYGELIILSQYN